MSLILLVDDSDAILAFERAALSAHHTLITASNGKEALARLAEQVPDAVILDLSMPEMDGEEVLARMRQSAVLRDVPVVVVSSEVERGKACLGMGANVYLPKPLRASELLATVTRVFEAQVEARRRRSVACLTVRVGQYELGVPLDSVETVVPQPLTTPIPAAPKYLAELFDLGGQPVFVLDLAIRLEVDHYQGVLDRKLLVVAHAGLKIGLCVDSVRDPEEIAADQVTLTEDLGGADHGELRAALRGVARIGDRLLPIIQPAALFSASDLAFLVETARRLE
jgi:CheY-like chemotaxis protein